MHTRITTSTPSDFAESVSGSDDEATRVIRAVMSGVLPPWLRRVWRAEDGQTLAATRQGNESTPMVDLLMGDADVGDADVGGADALHGLFDEGPDRARRFEGRRFQTLGAMGG